MTRWTQAKLGNADPLSGFQSAVWQGSQLRQRAATKQVTMRGGLQEKQERLSVKGTKGAYCKVYSRNIMSALHTYTAEYVSFTVPYRLSESILCQSKGIDNGYQTGLQSSSAFTVHHQGKVTDYINLYTRHEKAVWLI